MLQNLRVFKKKKKGFKILIPFVTFPSIVLELILRRSYHTRFCLEAQSRGPGVVTSSSVHILVSRLNPLISYADYSPRPIEDTCTLGRTEHACV